MWPFTSRTSALTPPDQEQRSTYVSIGDPAALAFFGALPQSYAGVSVSETTALTLSAVWRACNVVAGTIGTLPLRTIRTTPDGTREVISSFLDEPAGPDSLTSLEWAEEVVWHLLLHGNAFLLHRLNGAGALVGLEPIHPLSVGTQWDATRVGGKLYKVNLNDGTSVDCDASNMTQIMGPTLDGLLGMSVITLARNSLGTAIAGDQAAARLFRSGAMISGLVTPEEDLDADEALAIRDDFRQSALGSDNAGGVAVINRKLKFTPWTMSAEDAQFLDSRKFSIEEVARWFGVPPHLLMQTEKQTSWGTGVEEQNRGLRQFALLHWTTRIERRLSRLIPRTQQPEFDYSMLERPSTSDEWALLTNTVNAGLLTPNEARRRMNLPPVAGGDQLRVPTFAAPAPEEVPA